jgi:hypothetical protein
MPQAEAEGPPAQPPQHGGAAGEQAEVPHVVHLLEGAGIDQYLMHAAPPGRDVLEVGPELWWPQADRRGDVLEWSLLSA